MVERPWVSGPKELLVHGLEHFKIGTAFGHRMAMISVDNAVELAIQTWLDLPERSRGVPGPSRKELDEARGQLGRLLTLLEKYGGDKLQGIETGDIEFYHRIRNLLYHAGNGIAVEPDKVEAYLEIARVLFVNLYGVDLRGEVLPEPTTERAQVLARLTDLLAFLERRTEETGPRLSEPGTSYFDPDLIVDGPEDIGILRSLRNAVAHGGSAEVVHQAIEQVERLERRVSTEAGTSPGISGTCTARQQLPPGCAPYRRNRESGSTKHADPRLATTTIEVAPGHRWHPVEYKELLRRFGNSGFRGKYVLAFVPGGTEWEIRSRGIELNEGRGDTAWGVPFMYNALGCWGYPVTHIAGMYRLWAVDEAGKLIDQV